MTMNFALKLLVAGVVLGWSTAGMAADPIKIGVSGPFTGGSAPMGVSMRDGVKLAVADINAKGGVLGRQLQMVERDDEAKPERGVQIAQELINKEKVVATVGFINTGVALASQRFYQEAKIPVIDNVATGTVVTKQFVDQPENYVFRNAANDAIQSHMIVEEAVERRHFKKVAILADSTNYGQLGREHREVQHQGCRHDGPAAQGQAGRRRSGAHLRHRSRAGADRQRHGKTGLESAADRQLDAVDGELYRQRRQERRWHAHAANLHRRSDHAQAQGLHRRVCQSLPSA